MRPTKSSFWFIFCILAGMLGQGSAHAEPSPIGFVTGLQSPEDLIQIAGTPWVVVSAMRSKGHAGRLVVVDARDPTRRHPLYPAAHAIPGGPDAATFAPHGIATRPLGEHRVELLVVEHGAGQFVDEFVLDTRGDLPPIVTSVVQVAMPEGTSGNGVAPLPDGGFVVTSMFDPRDPAFVDAFARAEPTGAVWRHSPKGGWTMLAKPRLSAANGIATSKDGETLFVTEWAARRVWRIPLRNGNPISTPVTFNPDNLRWTDAGDLLVVGQTGGARELFQCEPLRLPCPMGYVVARIDPETASVKTILAGDDASYANDGFGAGTGAIQIGSSLWVGTYFGDRIARFALPRALTPRGGPMSEPSSRVRADPPAVPPGTRGYQ